MLDRWIDLALKRSVLGWTVFIAVVCFGFFATTRLGISQLPDVDFPVLNIQLSDEGASPQRIESELLDPVEERLLMIEGVEEMRSSARQGSGAITLNLGLNRDVNTALLEVQTALSNFKLPAGIDPPVIRKQNPEEDPILILSVTGTGSTREHLKDLIQWADQTFLDQLRFIEGVGEVSIGGFSARNLRIWFDPKKLKNLDLTVADVMEALRSQHLETASGQFDHDKKEVRVRLMGEAETATAVGAIQILKRGSQLIFDRVIRIQDVARIEDGLSDVRRMARLEGKQALSVIVRKQRNTNEVEVAKRVKARIGAIQSQLPPGTQAKVVIDFTRATEATVQLTTEKLLMAGVVTILVCFLFLGNLQSAFNILLSIPFSIIGTLLFLYFFRFTLNTFTLLALTLAISIVVDDAILILENIVRHRQLGKTPYAAASEGAKEILPAALASTAAVLAIFLPVAFMQGVIGKFFFQFGITMGVAVTLSLFEAILLTPMRARLLLETQVTSGMLHRFEAALEHLFARVSEVYRHLLTKALRLKWLWVVGGLALFATSLLLIRGLRQEYVPAQDQDLIILTAQTDPSSSLAFTDQKASEIEALLAKRADIESFFASIGAGGPSASVNQIFIPIKLKSRGERKLNHLQIQAELRGDLKRQVKGVRIQMRDLSARNLSTGRMNPIAFYLRGPDLQVLNQKANEIAKTLEREGLALDMDSDYKEGISELNLKPNRLALARTGISVESVALLLQAGVGGIRMGRIDNGGKRMDIRLKFEDGTLQTEKDLERLYVRAASGELLPISKLLVAQSRESLLTINRINRGRSISVFGNLSPKASQAQVLKRAEQLARDLLPSGYTFSLEGASAGFTQSFSGLWLALLMGIATAYFVLAIQFNSFVHPWSVLFALPFSVTGALLALRIFDLSINLFSFIGVIVLMGIAKKNSIMIVEFSNQLRHSNPQLTPLEAVVQAASVRLRPILMTSAATIGAGLPLILGAGFGSEVRLPMGVTIVGGTLVSTLLTLVVVPSLYLILVPLERSEKPETQQEYT